MKRMIALALCICLFIALVGCGHPESGESGTSLPQGSGSTSGESGTADPQGDGPSVHPASASVQLGPYRETILLPDVPGQNHVEVLSVRSDGTVDYVFSQRSETDFRISSLRDAGFHYYTIRPDGSAEEQPGDWMDQLDAVMAKVASKGEKLPVMLNGCEGRLYINLNLDSSSEYGAIFVVENGTFSQIPSAIQNAAGGQKIELTVGDQYELYYDAECCYAVSRLGFSGDGSLVPRSVYTFNTEGELLAEAPLIDAECYFPLAASGGKLWWINEGSSVLTVTDARTLSVLGKQPREPASYACRTVSPDGRSYWMLDWLYDKGVGRMVRYTVDEVTDLTEDFEQTPLLSPVGMPTELAVSNDGVVYAFSDGVLRQYVYDPGGAVTPAQTLKIWSLHDSQSVRNAVTLWNSTHSDCACEFTVASENSALTEEELIAQLNTELVNGEGPDVLLLDGLPLDSLINRGFLAPLDSLDTSDVYPNLLERFTISGSLYAIPSRMIPWMLGAAEERQPVNSLSGFADLIEGYSEPLTIGYGPYQSYEQSEQIRAHAAYEIAYADQVFDLWYPAWSNAIWANGSFHEEVYTEFLTQTNRLVSYYGLQTIDELLQIYEENPKTGLSRESYTIIDETNNYSSGYPYALTANPYAGMPNYDGGTYPGKEAVSYTMTPIPGPDGSGASVVTSILGLRAGGDAKNGTAFLQFALSFECQTALPYFGIHQAEGWAVTKSGTERNIKQYREATEEPGTIQNDLPQVLAGTECVVLDQILYHAAKETALRYYEGNLSAQEACSQAERETSLYLAEQR